MRVFDGVRATIFQVGPIAALLLVPAGLLPGGTWVWGHGLAFVCAYGALILAGNVALAVARPAHFGVRQQGVVARKDQRQPLIDAVGSAILFAYALAWLTFVPLDVFRFHIFAPPSAGASIVGGALAMVGAALTPLAVWENRFATPNLQEQSDRGQRVVDTGVYGVIRHPIYAGNLLLFGGMAVWLGSYAALLGAGVLLIATVCRILLEEAQLRASLPDYADYARRVRSRLIPFVV